MASRTRFLLLSLCTTLVVGGSVGCGNYNPEDLQFLNALPNRLDVALQPPGAEVEAETQNAVSQAQQAVSSCDEAPLRCEAQKTASNFNDLTGGILLIIDHVLQQPPTRRLKDKRIWGPFYLQDGEDLSVRVEMERLRNADAEHPFRFCFHAVKGELTERNIEGITCEADHEATGLTRILWGGLTPGDDAGELAASGAGRIVFDGNASSRINEEEEPELPAKLDIVYDHFGDSETIDVDISEVAGTEVTEWVPAQYHYARLASGAGDFFFIVKADINPGSTIFGGGEVELETFEIAAQWNGDRSGAARAAIYGGDLPDGPDGQQVRWDVSECWDQNLDTSYYRDPDEDKEDIGEIDNCQIALPPAIDAT